MSRILTVFPAVICSAILLFSSLADAAVYLESGGVLSVEGENFTSRMGDGSDAWFIVPTESPGDPPSFINASGGSFVQTLPDNGGANTSNPPSQNPHVDYAFNISTAGTYRAWLRWDGGTPSGNADSIYASIVELQDGAGGTNADWYRFAHGVDRNFNTIPWDGSGASESVSAGGGNVAATWALAPGDYTFRVFMREDGSALDKFVLQLSSLGTPSGLGPAESQLVPEPATYLVFGGLALCFGVAGWWRKRRKA